MKRNEQNERPQHKSYTNKTANNHNNTSRLRDFFCIKVWQTQPILLMECDCDENTLSSPLCLPEIPFNAGWENVSFYGKELHVPNKRVAINCPSYSGERLSRNHPLLPPVLEVVTVVVSSIISPGLLHQHIIQLCQENFEDWKLNCQLWALFKNQTPQLLEVWGHFI